MSEHNPYTPPTTELRDAPVVSAGPPPMAVRVACGLVLASLAFGVLTLLPGVREPEPDPPGVLVFVLVTYLVFGGLTLWFTLRTWQGRHWGRWALFVYLAAGWVIYSFTFADDMIHAPMAALINIGCVALEVSACALLFFGAGARWFATLRANARARA
ncbi:MAG: hypothetical protein ABI781_03570 [Burkholderiales bacterium]